MPHGSCTHTTPLLCLSDFTELTARFLFEMILTCVAESCLLPTLTMPTNLVQREQNLRFYHSSPVLLAAPVGGSMTVLSNYSELYALGGEISEFIKLSCHFLVQICM
jgi:hypothetical protein